MLRGSGDPVCLFVAVRGEPGATPDGALPVLDAARALGRRVLLPVTVGEAPLDWASFEGPGSLGPGPHGLLEPTGPRLGPSAVADAGLVVVPALAVDHRGVRLGRGGGHYDRTLPLAAREPAWWPSWATTSWSRAPCPPSPTTSPSTPSGAPARASPRSRSRSASSGVFSLGATLTFKVRKSPLSAAGSWRSRRHASAPTARNSRDSRGVGTRVARVPSTLRADITTPARPRGRTRTGVHVPTYPYACTACDHRFEQVQAFSDPSLTECPECGGRLRKVFSSVGIVFKGSGFYRNDARAGSGASSEKASASAESRLAASRRARASRRASTKTETKSSSDSGGSSGSSSSTAGSSSSGSSGSSSSSGSSAKSA